MTRFMRENGLTNVEIDGIKLTLAAAAMFPEKPSASAAEENPTGPISRQEFTDEEILLWSAPGVMPDPEDMN